MNSENIEENPQRLFKRTIFEQINHNKHEVEKWWEYKSRHEKVIEGLQIFPLELSLNCMIPIGKKALIKAKLTHTNEILVSLGSEYFAKYTASQAIELCNRRIEKANNMLELLKKEKYILQSRQTIPEKFDIFGSTTKRDLIEYWDNEKIAEWRVEHMKRKKEYRKRLAELKIQDSQELVTEEDIMKKLDALELQEELEDELYRLETEYQNPQDNDYSGESETDYESYSSDYSEEATNEIYKNKSFETNHYPEVLNNINEFEPHLNILVTSKTTNNKSINEITDDNSLIIANQNDSIDQSQIIGKNIKESKLKERRKVAFTEPQVEYFSNEEETEINVKKNKLSIIEQRLYEYSQVDNESEDENDEDNVIRIHFQHSNKNIITKNSGNNMIFSPGDIHKIIPRPKSILKKTSDHSKYIKQSITVGNPTTDDESEIDTELISVYNNIVKEVNENNIYTTTTMKPTIIPKVIRPISKFKMSRIGLKK